MGDEVLLGAMEGGFCGLEELTSPDGAILGPNLLKDTVENTVSSESFLQSKSIQPI